MIKFCNFGHVVFLFNAAVQSQALTVEHAALRGSFEHELHANEVGSFFESFDGERIFYLDYSDGNTALPVVFFISGFGGQGGVDPVNLQRFRDAGFRTISPDLRGQGKSAKPIGIQHWEKDAEARDIAALASHLGLDSYSLVAYSHGSIEALRLASLDDRLRCLVVGGMGDRCTDPHWDRPNQWPGFFELQAYAASPEAARQLRVNAWVQRGQACLSPEELANLRIPLGLIVGDNDFENGDARKLASLINGCELQRTPGDHVSTMLNSAWWSAVAQFLAKHPPEPVPGLQPEKYGREFPIRANGSVIAVHRYYDS